MIYTHKRLFDGIFKTLETGLSKLGDTSAKQTKAISELIQLIKEIPMDGRQGYDVLGFIYEYLISMFAANAGKKAGEFYTPHEVSLLMSEIVADHVKVKNKIQIYDPTSGSGSLLINIGQCVAKHMDDENNIKYYAQELKENTYNLTRMNLVMRGILPNNIFTRNGDTLEDDWPYFEESDPVNTYNPLYVDAVVSNPPYSQKWDPDHKENDPRYARFGLAPKSKADYAFLLHDLYHLKPDGIMTIVLPHGVLFRGGEEGEIRKNLIENNHLDTIIGLPDKIFFGTGIATIVMVLKQKRTNTDVLLIDASKGFAKEGKNNRLRASDIKKVYDTVINREDREHYAKVVSRDQIRKNEYNLYIQRYVSSNATTESWDIYASMFGGVPQSEIDDFAEFWEAFPTLRKALFSENGTPYAEPLVNDLAQAIHEHTEIANFRSQFAEAFSNFNDWLHSELIDQMFKLNVSKQESRIGSNIFNRLESIPLIDKYHAYQILDDYWQQIVIDIEILQTEGFNASRVVDPNMVIKTKKGKKEEVQDGWRGRIMPFELVQATYLSDELESLQQKEQRLSETVSGLEEIIETLSEADGEYRVLNNANDKFAITETKNELIDILADVESEEILALKDYFELLNNKAKKGEKEAYIQEHTQVDWTQMEPNKDGTYGKPKVAAYILELQSSFEFPEDSFAYKLIKAIVLLEQEKVLKAEIKDEADELHLLTKSTIEDLSDDQVHELLRLKWIVPLNATLHQLPVKLIDVLGSQLKALADKYSITYADNARAIQKSEAGLVDLIDELDGNEFDMQGLSEFKSFFKGE